MYENFLQIRSKSRKHILAGVVALMAVSPAYSIAAAIDGKTIVSRVEKLLWGRTSEGEYEMIITTPHWSRTLKLRSWMQRPDKTFVRILSPKKEAGIGSLRIGNEMWNYLPNIERVIKIPPSMMLQPWMGSDFTNDDLVKESSMVDDYVHRIEATETVDGIEVYRVISTPRPEAAVVWGKLVYRVRKHDLMPLSQQYYDERGELIKELTFSDVKKMGGRLIPTLWTMKPMKKPGKKTEIRLLSMNFNQPIKTSIFTLRNLRRSR